MQTDDLFLGALGLVRGGTLRGVEVRGLTGKRVAVFSIEGPAMDEIERDYYGGQSMVDLRLLKFEVARLKNVAFDALREEEKRYATRDEGRYRTAALGEPYRRGRR